MKIDNDLGYDISNLPSVSMMGNSNAEFTKQTGYPLSRVKTWVQWATPDMCEAWLEGKPLTEGLKGKPMQNRNSRPRRVNTISKDMQEGNFEFTGVPIIFDSNGFLIDGQHRCKACVAAGVGFFVAIVFGVDRHRASKGIDDVAARTYGDRLRMRLGIENANSCAATALIMWQFDQPLRSSSWPKPSYTEMEETYLKYQVDIDWAVTSIGSYIEPGLSSGGAPITAAFAFARVANPSLVESAALRYKSGKVDRDDPMHKLRAFMASAPAKAKVGNRNSSSQHSRHAVSLVALGWLERILTGSNNHKMPAVDVEVIGRISKMRGRGRGLKANGHHVS